MSDSAIDGYCEFVLPLIKEAGQVILTASDIKIELKKEDFDIVTEYDKRVEKTLVEKLKEKYPNHKFIGEEESSESEHIPELTDDPTWIIDPIDGTANFVRAFPITCISVGLTIKKEIVLGIVFNPFMNELYLAKKGRGAFLNGKQIFTNKCSDIRKAVLNCELSLGRVDSLRELYISRFAHLIGILQGIRSLGCQAMGLCYVAKGISDAYQCDGLFPWDCVAGVLLIQEAGGYVCSSDGSPFNLMEPNIIAAASKPLAEQIAAVLHKADSEMKQKMCK